ncbi:Acetyl esterase [Sporomusa rhizae]|uniref:alpha/beta hydrolase n=1 Tax=Sporomusa rhizae TaxID=357999 RepID=UPI00352AEDEB
MQEIVMAYENKTAFPIKATFHRAAENRKNVSILYLHGGGMVFGTKDDLPKAYIELILENGYDLLMLDYLLAPESNLEEMITTLELTINNFTNDTYKEIGLTTPRYLLFGRSAGSFLALLAAKRKNIMRPAGLILFYGYYNLAESSFSAPAPYYLKIPKVEEAVASAIAGNTPLTYGPIQKRFALYLFARQTGNWLSLLAPKNTAVDLKKYSLSLDDLKELPPAFLAASPFDYDVPFEMSKTMAETIPSAHLYIAKNAEHDFDRNPNDIMAIEAYHRMLSWMQEKLKYESVTTNSRPARMSI